MESLLWQLMKFVPSKRDQPETGLGGALAFINPSLALFIQPCALYPEWLFTWRCLIKYYYELYSGMFQSGPVRVQSFVFSVPSGPGFYFSGLVRVWNKNTVRVFTSGLGFIFVSVRSSPGFIFNIFCLQMVCFAGFEHRECLRTMNFEKCCRMH